MAEPLSAGTGTAPGKGEEFEIVDDAGNVVGRAPRGVCHGDPSLTHRSVHVFVTDAQGRILLQKRSADKDIQPGKWDTSVGGHLAVGEDYPDAAAREAAEELGLVVTPGELRELHRYLWRTDVECELVATYAVVRDGPFTRQEEEIDELRFFRPEELEALVGTGALTPNLEHELGLLQR